MITFAQYLTVQRGSAPIEQIAEETKTPLATLQGYEKYINFELNEANQNNAKPPSNTQLIASWNYDHNPDNLKSITSLTIAQFEQRMRAIVRDELNKAG